MRSAQRHLTLALIPLLILVFSVAPPTPPAPPVFAAPLAQTPPSCGGTFNAVADTYVNEGAPAVNNGAATTLLVGRGARGDQRALLRFDLGSSIPADSTIERAELLLVVTQTPASQPFRLEVREATQSWGETTATWNAQPTLGASYGPQGGRVEQNGLRLDVTPLVTRWATGALRNTGLALLPAERALDLGIASAEAAGATYIGPRLTVTCAPPDAGAPPLRAQADALQQAGLTRLKQQSQTPARLELTRGALSHALLSLPAPASVGADLLAQARWFLREQRDALRLLDPDQELQLFRRTADNQHLFFRQRHDGIPVYPATLGVHIDRGVIRSVGGQYVPEIGTTSKPRLSAAQAEALAAALAGDGAIRPGQRAVKLADGSVRPTIDGTTQLRYLNLGLLGRADTKTYLTWRVNLTGPRGPLAYYIDALSGKLRHTQFQTAQEFDLEYLSDANEEASSSCYVFVDTDPWFDEDGKISGANPDAEGFSAFTNVKGVWNYWKNRFGRDSYDDDGEELEIYMHAGNPTAYTGGICDIFQFSTTTTSRDVVGHEFTHAVDNFEGELEYETQSGALDESFADVFGYFADSSNSLVADGTNLANNPVSGVPGCSSTPAIRDISNPPCYGDPDHMQAASSGDGVGFRGLGGADPGDSNDNGFVHTNSGIPNKAAWLIINGGTHNGIIIQGLGKTKAERLFYNVLTGYVSEGTQFSGMRNAAVAAASWQVVQGNFSVNDVCQVGNAYGSVGIGSVDTDCDGTPNGQDPDNDNDGVADAPDNCNNIFNPGQSDIDGDGQGDACDSDDDGDGDLDTADNCPTVSNSNQANFNGDGQGDVCDDSDGDLVLDSIDNCRQTANSDQANYDGDSQGDACDNDDDNDGDLDNVDNCPNYNPDQADSDNDGVGNACDKCPTVSDPDNRDPDNDGLGNPCDADDDNDGIPDGEDICQYEPGLGCLKLGTLVATDVLLNAFARFPIPHCIVCGENLVPGAEVTIDMSLPVGYTAKVIDANGKLVAKGQAIGGGALKLSFDAGAVGGQQPGAVTNGVALAAGPAPDQASYYLDVTPAPGVSGTQRYPLTLKVTEGVPTRISVPDIRR